jgi:hypothetical protein
MMIKCGTCTAVRYLLLLMYYSTYTGCSTLAGGGVPFHDMYCVRAQQRLLVVLYHCMACTVYCQAAVLVVA